jgi:hypothetical protein
MDLASLFFYEPPKMGSSFITFFISSEMGVSMGRGEGGKDGRCNKERKKVYSFDLSLKPIEHPHLL